MLTCRYCEMEFELTAVPAHLRKVGYRDVCAVCKAHGDDDEHIDRYLGLQGGEGIPKAANIAIIRDPKNDPSAKFQLMTQRSAGFNACLPVSSYNQPNSSCEFSGEWDKTKANK